MSRFEPTVLAVLRSARTVRVETSAGPRAPVHSAIIWVVVDDVGRVLVRSWRGERGRWYRELIANPNGTLVSGSRRIPFRAEPASDSARIDACSRGLREKYASSRGSLAEMLLDEVLLTTLELTPA